jgi:dienelactone hydrolase
MRALMTGALVDAENRGADVGNAVAMGYCFGGAAVLEWARSGADLKGFATFHGGLKTPDGQDYSNARGKILIHARHGRQCNHHGPVRRTWPTNWRLQESTTK